MKTLANHVAFMKRQSDKAKKPRQKRGPKPEVLKLEGDWMDNMRKSLQKRKPAGGWPK